MHVLEDGEQLQLDGERSGGALDHDQELWADVCREGFASSSKLVSSINSSIELHLVLTVQAASYFVVNSFTLWDNSSYGAKYA